MEAYDGQERCSAVSHSQPLPLLKDFICKAVDSVYILPHKDCSQVAASPCQSMRVAATLWYLVFCDRCRPSSFAV